MNYRQIDRFKRERLFEIINSQYLRVTRKSRKGNQEYTVDLLALSPKGKRITLIAWRWLVLAALFLSVFSAAVYFLATHFDLSYALYLVPVMLVALYLSGASIYRLIYTSERKYVFYTNFANYPLVEILLNKPDKKKFNLLIDTLRQGINQIANTRSVSKDCLQAGEMKMLRRLSGENILTTNDYEQAKAKIFGFNT